MWTVYFQFCAQWRSVQRRIHINSKFHLTRQAVESIAFIFWPSVQYWCNLLIGGYLLQVNKKTDCFLFFFFFMSQFKGLSSVIRSEIQDDRLDPFSTWLIVIVLLPIIVKYFCYHFLIAVFFASPRKINQIPITFSTVSDWE